MDFESEPARNPYMSPDADPFQPPGASGTGRRHSGLGIASFVISILGGVALFTLVAIAGVMAASNPGGIDEQAPATIILGLSIFGVGAIHFLGIGLGVAGLAQPDRARTFAVLGLTFNILVIVGICGLMALGMAAG